jgi:hyperosmotically inducible periplasmic protein
MHHRGSKSKTLVVVGSIVLASLFAITPPARAQDQSTPTPNTAPDNTAKNKNHKTTADQQTNAAGDRDLTAQIRKSIIADKSLSTYAHNVKIITINGMVTLKGPVNSDAEKQTIADLAAKAAGGADKVTNKITVKQS